MSDNEGQSVAIAFGLPAIRESWVYTRFVRHDDVPAFQMKGWTVDDSMADCHHGRWAQLMIWKGEGEPDAG